MKNIQSITVDVVPDLIPTPRVNVIKGDSETRYIGVTVLNNGEPLELEDGVTVSYVYLKPDCTQVINPTIQQPILISRQITQHGIPSGDRYTGQVRKQPAHLCQYRALTIYIIVANTQFGRTAMCTDVDRIQILVPANTRKRGRW